MTKFFLLFLSVLASLRAAQGSAIVHQLEDDRRLALEITDKLDLSVDPCQDFYRFACGGYILAAHGTEDVHGNREYNAEMVRRLSALTLEDSSDESQSMTKAERTRNELRNFMKSCANKEAGTAEAAIVITSTLQQLTSSLREFKDDKQRLVAEIISQAGVHASTILLFFAIVRDPETDLMRLAVLKPLKFNGDTKANSSEYSLMRDKDLGSLEDLGAALHWESRFEDPAEMYQEVTYSGELNSESEYEYQVFNWSLISIVLTGKDSDIYLHQPEAIERLDAQLAEMDTELIIDRAIAKFRDQMMARAKLLDRIPCAMTATVYLSILVLREMVDSETFPHADEWRSQTAQVAQRYSESIEASIESADWLDARLKASVLRKLRKMHVSLAYPQSHPNMDDEEEMFAYHDMNLKEDDFWGNCQNIIKTLKDNVLQHIGQPYDHYWIASATNLHQSNAFYSPTLNSVQVLFPIANFTKKVLERPDYIKFADEIGHSIGHEIGHAVDTMRLFLDGFQTVVDLAEETKDAIRERIKCLHDHFKTYEMDGVRLQFSAVAREIVADAIGMKHAVNILKQSSPNYYQPSVLSGLEDLTEAQVYFTRYAQNHCSVHSDADWAVVLETGSMVHPPDPIRVNGAVAVNLDFRHAFSCAEDTPAGSAQTCDFV